MTEDIATHSKLEEWFWELVSFDNPFAYMDVVVEPNGISLFRKLKDLYKQYYNDASVNEVREDEKFQQLEKDWKNLKNKIYNSDDKNGKMADVKEFIRMYIKNGKGNMTRYRGRTTRALQLKKQLQEIKNSIEREMNKLYNDTLGNWNQNPINIFANYNIDNSDEMDNVGGMGNIGGMDNMNNLGIDNLNNLGNVGGMDNLNFGMDNLNDLGMDNLNFGMDNLNSGLDNVRDDGNLNNSNYNNNNNSNYNLRVRQGNSNLLPINSQLSIASMFTGYQNDHKEVFDDSVQDKLVESVIGVLGISLGNDILKFVDTGDAKNVLDVARNHVVQREQQQQQREQKKLKTELDCLKKELHVQENSIYSDNEMQNLRRAVFEQGCIHYVDRICKLFSRDYVDFGEYWHDLVYILDRLSQTLNCELNRYLRSFELLLYSVRTVTDIEKVKSFHNDQQFIDQQKSVQSTCTKILYIDNLLTNTIEIIKWLINQVPRNNRRRTYTRDDFISTLITQHQHIFNLTGSILRLPHGEARAALDAAYEKVLSNHGFVYYHLSLVYCFFFLRNLNILSTNYVSFNRSNIFNL